jgi:TPP-dependent pyruvate/acetoin dehydrogenase alpha subunit
LKESGALSDDQFAVIEAEVASSIAQALRFADESPYPDSDEARTDVA